MNPHEHEAYIRHTFDTICKMVLKFKARDIHDQDQTRAEHETLFSEMSAQMARELASLSTTDNYFVDEYVFSVLGESVGITDVDLAGALNAIPADRREIVLMSYFFDMTDREIADSLNLARRTVAYRRTNALRKLKKLLESEE